MQKEKFELLPDQEFLELFKILKSIGLAETGGQAKMLVADGLVMVNGEPEDRKAAKIRRGDVIIVDEEVTITVV